MHGAEFKWLVSRSGKRGEYRVHLVRSGLGTLAVGIFCLACAVAPVAPTLLNPAAPAVAVATQATVAAPESAPADWGRTLVRLCFLFPQFLPRDH